VLTLPVAALAVINPRRFFDRCVGGRKRFLLLVCLVTFLGLLLPVFCNPHYGAPLTCAIYALVVASMRHVRQWQWQGKPTGLALVGAVPVICVALLPLRAAAPQLHIPLPLAYHYSWCSPHLKNLDRARVLARLKGYEGRHLLIVRYKPDHDVRWEWVYNEADIDKAKVVWARQMDPAEDEKLIGYFSDRDIWLVEPDEKPPRLSPYPTIGIANEHH
jgi:hypothetical protein